MSNTEITTKHLKIYTGQAAKVLKFLQNGCTETQAAEAVGVTLGYVSQLCQEPDFREQIGDKLQQDFEAAIETDKNYAEVELEISRRLKKMTPFILSLDDLLKTTRVLSTVKKKVAPAVNPGSNGDSNNPSRSVKMILPQITINNNFIVNPNSEVVAIGDRQLTTLNANSIDALAQRVMEAEIVTEQSQPLPKIEFRLPEKVAKHVSHKDKYSDL